MVTESPEPSRSYLIPVLIQESPVSKMSEPKWMRLILQQIGLKACENYKGYELLSYYSGADLKKTSPFKGRNEQEGKSCRSQVPSNPKRTQH